MTGTITRVKMRNMQHS